MFTIEIAGLPIGIDNRYRATEHYCKAYLTQKPPLFTVSATMEEIVAEVEFGGNIWTREFICIHRKIAEQLPKYQAFVLHAAAIQTGGKAYLFTAPSGTGKTTHILLWKELYGDAVEIINGDKPVIRLMDGKFYVCGSPWNGKERLGEKKIAPLAGLCFLGRAKENSIRETDAGACIKEIARQVFIPPQKTYATAFLSLLDSFLSQIPLYELRCNTEPEAAELSYRTLTGDLR